MSEQITTRAVAIYVGQKTYFTGKPCKHGHVAERYSATGHCIECRSASAKARRDKNHEKFLARDRLWREENREKRVENDREWRARNKEKKAEYQRAYRERNRHIVYENKARRRSASVQRQPSWFGEFDQFVMREAADLARARKEATGIEWDVDHMIPLAGREASGLHCAANLQVIPSTMNRVKHNKMVFITPGEWISRL